MGKNKEEIQKVLEWVKQESPEPWEILYRLVVEYPQLIDVKVGQLLVISWGLRDWLLDAWSIARKQGRQLRTKNVGGELLTRLPMEIVLPASKILNFDAGEFISRAFGEMPVCEVEEISPFLINLQMEYIKQELNPNFYYSINIEAPTQHNESWLKTLSALRKNQNLRVRLELIERRQFPVFALKDLAVVCAGTGMGIYLDDLGANAHSLPEQRGYICQILKYLGRYIVAVKIDYEIVKDMAKEGDEGDDVAANVVKNIFYFTRLWHKALPGIPPCSVIFESMPNKDKNWLLNIQKVCQVLFDGIYWQID